MLTSHVFHRSRGAVLGASLAAALLLVVSAPAGAATVGPVTDEIGVLKIPAGAPIVIGAYWVLSGADTALGTDEKRGVEVAIKDWNNKVAGHPIRFIAEDDGCNAEGGQTAATKLAANPDIAIVLGPACSSAATPGAPILWKAGIVNICTACTAPALTSPERKPEYNGFARTVYSDIDQGREDAKWIYNALGARNAVTIHDGSPYAQQLVKVMAKNFQGLGGKVAGEEAVAPTDVDMHPLLTRISTVKPDVIYMPIFVAAGAQIVRQVKETSGLEKVVLVGGGSMMTADMIKAVGPAIVGFRFTYPDISPEAMGKGYGKFVDEYKEMFGEAPISGFHANAYDAATLAFKAIEKVAKTESDGTTYIGRKALRDAVFATSFEGIAGPIKCDAYGQCAEFKFAAFQYTDADPNTFKIGENPKKIAP